MEDVADGQAVFLGYLMDESKGRGDSRAGHHPVLNQEEGADAANGPEGILAPLP